MKNNRIEWIDIYKGLLITCVVIGHTSSILVKYMYLFHIPAFFFISGYTEKLKEKTLSELLEKKFFSLLIPYFGINIIYVLLRVFLEFIDLQSIYYKDKILVSNIYYYLKSIFQLNWITDFGGATWFLFALFSAFMFAKIILIFSKNNTYFTLIITFVLMFIIYFLNSNGVYFKNYIDISILASFYILLGVLFKEKELLNYFIIPYNSLIYISTIIYLYFFCNILHAEIDMVSRRLHNPILDTITIAIAVILLFNISYKIEKTELKKIFICLGKITLPILSLHFLILRFIFTIEVGIGIVDSEVLYQLTPSPNMLKGIFYAVIVLLLVKVFDHTLKDNRIYNIIFRGKIAYKPTYVTRKTKTSIIIYFMYVVFFISSIPYSEINALYFHQNENYSYVRNMMGKYEDGWIAKEFSGVYRSRKNGILKISFWIPDITPSNTIEIFINDRSIYKEKLESGTKELEFQVPSNEEIFLEIRCSHSFIPAQIEDSEDQRELSIILEKLKFE